MYSLLDKLQLSISLFYVKWKTTSLNSFFHSLGARYDSHLIIDHHKYIITCRKNILQPWFLAGVVFGIVAMIMSVVLLVANLLFMVLSWKRQSQQVSGVLTPVVCSILHFVWEGIYLNDIVQIPGVNVPTSHLGYYVFALLAAGILHEFGHAFAAVRYLLRNNVTSVLILFN